MKCDQHDYLMEGADCTCPKDIDSPAAPAGLTQYKLDASISDTDLIKIMENLTEVIKKKGMAYRNPALQKAQLTLTKMALLMGFTWANSPEKHEYWEAIYKRLGEIGEGKSKD